MLKNHEYYVVDKLAVPSVLSKTLAVKKLLENNPDMKVSDAVKREDLSRSAFYKYKDMVFEYSRPLGKIVTLNATLRDKAGVLSAFLMEIYNFGGNILTVNQSLPLSGSALVTVSLRTADESQNISNLLERLKAIKGVVSVKQIPGE